jgi:hypothetical protein
MPPKIQGVPTVLKSMELLEPPQKRHSSLVGQLLARLLQVHEADQEIWMLTVEARRELQFT